MKNFTEPLEPDTFYHVFNRGINGEDLFKEEKNYSFFVEKVEKHLSPHIDIYAFCLLKNHFHLLVKTKDENVLRLTRSF